MREWHKPRIQALVDAGVDLLALETIPCQEEADMLVELLREYPNTKAWLAFSCKVGILYFYYFFLYKIKYLDNLDICF